MLEVIQRNMFKSKIKLQHDGVNMRNETTGRNPEYNKMINSSDTDYEFMSSHGFIADYLHSFQSLNVVELSNDGNHMSHLKQT